jgi:hypothetical protein
VLPHLFEKTKAAFSVKISFFILISRLGLIKVVPLTNDLDLYHECTNHKTNVNSKWPSLFLIAFAKLIRSIVEDLRLVVHHTSNEAVCDKCYFHPNNNLFDNVTPEVGRFPIEFK